MATATNVSSISQRSTAALLQQRLKQAEAQIDASTANAGALIADTLRAAEEAGIHRTEIQRMLLRLHSSIGHSLKSQWDMQLFHQQCRNHLDKLNVEEIGWGDTSGTPPMASAMFQAAEAAEA